MDHSCLVILRGIQFFHVLNLIFSFLGIYDPNLSLRYLVPCHIILFLSTHLNTTQQLLIDAEAINAVPPESEYRTHLDRLANQFAAMRVESNHARGPFQQLRLAIQRGLTYRLYVLYYRVEGMKSELELAIDKQQLRIAESATGTAVPSHAAGHRSGATATPANDVVDPTLPLPATSP